MPEKAGIQVGDFPGFRIALAIASLPGMTDEFGQLLGRHTSATKRGSYSVDGMFQQMVYRDGGARSQKGLTLWAEVAVAPKPSVNIMPYFVGGGVSCQGAVPGRDIDIASAGLIYGTFSRYIPRTTAETAIKANYQVNSKRRLSITADFQYIIRPSGSGAIGNAAVLGTQLAISF